MYELKYDNFCNLQNYWISEAICHFFATQLGWLEDWGSCKIASQLVTALTQVHTVKVWMKHDEKMLCS